MKYFFVEPVCYGFLYSPIIGIPTLIGILEENNHEAKYKNLNNDFINKCFDEDFYSSILEKRNFILTKNRNEIPSDLCPFFTKIESAISKEKNAKIFDKYKNIIAKKIYKEKKYFLNELLCEFASKRIRILPQQLGITDLIFNDFILADYLYSRVGTNEENNKKTHIEININLIKYYINEKFSPIDEYLDEQADKLIAENTDCIGISVGLQYQFLPALILAYKIKQKSNIHINVGGNYFNEIRKKIKNLAELFNTFFDSVSIEDNTKTITDILKYINKEISIEEVSNILYLENGEIKKSKSSNYIEFKDLPIQSFTGYDIENLLTPELILPIQTSESCYWGKCIYCECYNAKKYSNKPVVKVIDEIDVLSKKYATKYFCFWDNSMHPNYLSKLADLLLEKKLNIKFSIYARFEKEFDYKLLKKLKKAGCLKIHWGLDSANQRVLEYIQKGISIKESERILKDSKKAGIFNFVYVILGHPTETRKEMEDLYPFLKRNHKNINNLLIIPYVLFTTKSKLSEQQEANRNLISLTIDERKNFKNYLKQKFPHIVLEDFDEIDETLPMLLYIEKYGNGFKRIINKKFMSFIKSHPKLLSHYLKIKAKQVIKNK